MARLPLPTERRRQVEFRRIAIACVIVCAVIGQAQAAQQPPVVPRNGGYQSGELPRPLPKSGEINLGTGTVVSINGDIVTNAHVVARCNKLAVLDTHGDEHPARVVLGEWMGKDMALIQVPGGLPPSDALPSHIAFPPPAEMPQAGEPIRIAGYSYVQGKAFNLTLSDGSVLQPAQGTGFAFAFQGALDVGNSGGAVIDSRGRLVGLIAGRLIAANNVGVGFTANEVMSFLDAEGINFERTSWIKPLPAAVVQQIAQRATVGIKCTY